MLKEDTEKQYKDLIEAEDSTLTLGDIESMSQDKELLQHFENKYGPDLYSQIFLTLTHEIYETDKAKALWEGVNLHLQDLTNMLGRNPGVSVATLDYLSNIHNSLSEPVIIEENKSEFISETTTKDGLTQLYLRSVFDVTLAKELEKMSRTHENLSLLMIDIDDFKQVNDKYGHIQGDDVLQKIGAVVNKNIRKMDLAARYGGEEIAVIMPKSTISDALLLAERIREKISAIQFHEFAVTVSIGVSHADKNLNTPESLIQAADEALYEAKNLGKNRIVMPNA